MYRADGSISKGGMNCRTLQGSVDLCTALGLQMHTDEREVCVGKFMAVRRKLHLKVDTNIE